MKHIYKKRVEYLDCDPSGFAKNSLFQEWMLAGSMDLFLAEGINYFERIEKELGLFCATKKVQLEFIGIARPLDDIEIHVSIGYIKNFSMKFFHEFKRGDTLLACGFIEHVSINSEGEFGEIPEWVREKFAKYIQKK